MIFIVSCLVSFGRLSGSSSFRCWLSRRSIDQLSLNAGVHPNAVFWLSIMILTQISRSRFKQSKLSMLISYIYDSGFFNTFFGDFRCIWDK